MGDLVAISQDFQAVADRYAAFNPQDNNFDLGNGKKLNLSLPLSYFLQYGFDLREFVIHLKDEPEGLRTCLQCYTDEDGKPRFFISNFLELRNENSRSQKVQEFDLEFEPSFFGLSLHQFNIYDWTSDFSNHHRSQSLESFYCYAREGESEPINNISKRFAQLTHQEIGQILFDYFRKSVIEAFQGKIPDFSELQSYTSVQLNAPTDIRRVYENPTPQNLVLDI